MNKSRSRISTRLALLEEHYHQALQLSEVPTWDEIRRDLEPRCPELAAIMGRLCDLQPGLAETRDVRWWVELAGLRDSERHNVPDTIRELHRQAYAWLMYLGELWLIDAHYGRDRSVDHGQEPPFGWTLPERHEVMDVLRTLAAFTRDARLRGDEPTIGLDWPLERAIGRVWEGAGRDVATFERMLDADTDVREAAAALRARIAREEPAC